MSPAVHYLPTSCLPDPLHFPFPSSSWASGPAWETPWGNPGSVKVLGTFNFEASLQEFQSLHYWPSGLLKLSQPKGMAELLKALAFIMGHSSSKMVPISVASLPGRLGDSLLLAHTIDSGQDNAEERKHPPVDRLPSSWDRPLNLWPTSGPSGGRGTHLGARGSCDSRRGTGWTHSYTSPV